MSEGCLCSLNTAAQTSVALPIKLAETISTWQHHATWQVTVEQDPDPGTEHILEWQVKNVCGITHLPRVGAVDLWEGEAWLDFPRPHPHPGVLGLGLASDKSKNLGGNLVAVRLWRVGVTRCL